MFTRFPCAFSPWSPGIGDNHPVGWLTVALYLIAAYQSALVARQGLFPQHSRQRERWFWWLCAILLTLFALNKQLDLQSLLTSVARCAALDQGWYENRRDLQRGFILAVFVTGGVGVAICGLLLRGTFARTGVAILGLGVVSTFVVIRAASFHNVDILIDLRVLGMRMNWLLELPGPLLILFAAVLVGRPHRPDQP